MRKVVSLSLLTAILTVGFACAQEPLADIRLRGSDRVQNRCQADTNQNRFELAASELYRTGSEEFELEAFFHRPEISRLFINGKEVPCRRRKGGISFASTCRVHADSPVIRIQAVGEKCLVPDIFIWLRESNDIVKGMHPDYVFDVIEETACLLAFKLESAHSPQIALGDLKRWVRRGIVSRVDFFLMDDEGNELYPVSYSIRNGGDFWSAPNNSDVRTRIGRMPEKLSAHGCQLVVWADCRNVPAPVSHGWEQMSPNSWAFFCGLSRNNFPNRQRNPEIEKTFIVND